MKIDLDALEAVARDATPGPWIADPPSAWDTDDVGGYQLQAAVRVKDSGSITWDDHGGEVFKPADAEFIATFDPPTVRALITRLREAERHNVQLLREAVKREGRVKRAEGAIAEALNHDPLHGRKEGMHCGGMAPCIRDALTAYKYTNQEGGNDGT